MVFTERRTGAIILAHWPGLDRAIPGSGAGTRPHCRSRNPSDRVRRDSPALDSCRPPLVSELRQPRGG